MLVEIGGPEDEKIIGGKAAGLNFLRGNGFCVPDGIVLPCRCWQSIREYNDPENHITEILLGDDAPDQKSRRLCRIISGFYLPDDLAREIVFKINPNQFYAVRSSGMMEDTKEYSFAGQYDSFLQVYGWDDLQKAIIQCYASLYSETVLTYVHNQGLDFQNLDLAVIIQKMVSSDKSGVAFSLNPVTGEDTQMLVEVAQGFGESLVSGKINPDRYVYDWQEKKDISLPDDGILTEREWALVKDQVLDITRLYGAPCDIEFAFSKGELFVLQCRPITRLQYAGLEDIWTTADFKDGGVSATVCLPFMWSLYEYVFDSSLRKFLLDSYILPRQEIRRLIRMFYGRPYWNLSVVKNAMSRVPGFKEREFDKEFGVSIHYEGEGRTTRICPKSVAHIARVAVKQMLLLKKREGDLPRRYARLRENAQVYRNRLESDIKTHDLEKICRTLIKDDYFHSETTYFTQIYLNTVHQSLFKDRVLAYADMALYLELISGLDSLSHLRPFYDLWEISREIRKNKDAYAYWESGEIAGILKDLNAGRSEFQLDRIRIFIEKYGYHSDKELDISYPCFDEYPQSVLAQLVQTVSLEDSYGPEKDRKDQYQRYDFALNTLSRKMNPRKFAEMKRKTEKMRKMLWWREELRDISTQYYHLIRRYMLLLAGQYRKTGVLEQVEDIWYIKIEDLWEYIEHKITSEDLRKRVNDGRLYYMCFRNFMSENEIGSEQQYSNVQSASSLCGIGCNPGIVTGTARVVDSLESIGRLCKDDILVARFTDTGWTSQFALLKGIVTEYGGMLCHSAIVSREYGIPCIVGVDHAMSSIPDGSRITIDGASGRITLEEKYRNKSMV